MGQRGRTYSLLLLWGLGFFLAGCASVSYDPQADQQLTALSQGINQQLLTWEHQAENSATPVAYDSKFYDKIEADLTTLEIRMEASQDPATQKLIGIFDSLNGQLETMRKLHKDKGHLTAAYLHGERLTLNVQIATLMTFELSLKGSQASSTAKTGSTATATTQKAALPAGK